MAQGEIQPAFIEGFVQRCIQLGMDEDETVEQFKKHAHNVFLGTPAIYAGFQEQLAKSSEGINKAAMARLMTPDFLAFVMDTRIKYADDALSVGIRKEAGMPEPSWDNVPEDIQEKWAALVKAAGKLGPGGLHPDHPLNSGLTFVQKLQQMPLHQRVILSSMVGAGANGALRAVRPNREDEQEDRNVFDRTTRGMASGAAGGAAGMVGGSAGGFIGDRMDPSFGIPGMIAGSLAGSMASRRLINDYTH